MSEHVTAGGRHRRGTRGTRRSGRLIVITLVLAVVAVAAWAYWTATSTPGGNGVAAASTVNPGATPSATAVGGTVTVSWAAGTLSSGQAVSGYQVKRYDSATLTAQTVLTGCAGTVTAATCTETGVPTGSWRYSVTPVFAANWTGGESAKSTTVVTDTTPPANALSLSTIVGGAFLSGTTVYYRGSAAGSFTLTNAVTDAGSGPVSSQTGALSGTSTGWTHVPSTVSTPAGGPYVSNSFAWAAATTSGPGETVTGRDAGGNGAATTLSFANDSTAPAGGSVGYTNGNTGTRSVSVTFAPGADGGAGINAAVSMLQRASAPLAAGACGSYTVFSNVSTAPGSPYTDTAVANSTCYRYQYAVTDNTGNQAVYTSASVAMVDYAGAVKATAGALSLWRLGETPSTSDSFTGTAGTVLSSHTPELGTSWTRWVNDTITGYLTNAGRVRKDGVTGGVAYYSAVTPGSANYRVEADVVVKSVMNPDDIGVEGRVDLTNTTGTGTFYAARYNTAAASWQLVKSVAGAASALGTFAQTLTAGSTYRVGLDMSGTTIRVLVDGVQRITVTDTSITVAGRAGVRLGSSADTAVESDTAGLQLDNFEVTPLPVLRALDSKGSNPGDFFGGVLLGGSGAPAGDPDTSAAFDGINDYVQAVGTTGIPVGAAPRSVELWMKSTAVTQQVLFSYGSLASAQEFGLWVNAGGTSLTAWGYGGGNDLVFSLASGINDGAWHQVVETYDGSAITIYIDGVALPSQALTLATVMNASGFGIGANLTAGDSNSGEYFSGSLDDISLYTTALSQATVTGHYQLATVPVADTTGPTGGSVDASGLGGTGARYSTSATLSLVLAKGSDPSGVAATGAQLLRATATLSSAAGTGDGVCGTFGAYTVVGGGTDPASPKADTVADQACYSYQYVVTDSLGNASTYTSPNIKVDTTASTAPALAFSAVTNTYWSGSGTTVYYRPTAATGSFTATAAATDAASGIAGYTFPALGTNWTSTPGGLGVNTYSWSGAPAAPASPTVFATDNAAVVSAGTAFAPTADSTAPTAGTITYADGVQSGSTVSVAFTTGTDSASGLGSRLLQRASGSYTGGVCAAAGAFATIATNPTSPYTDTVPSGSCYQYQYVVADNVGNTTTASSASVAKFVTTGYAPTIQGTAGLTDYYRLGETPIAADSFTGTAGTLASAHTPEVGTSWTRWTGDTITGYLTNANRLRKDNVSGGVAYYTAPVPSSANYRVEADVVVKSISGSAVDDIGVIGRQSLTGTGIGTFYGARYETIANTWLVYKVVNGTETLMNSYSQTLTAGSTYRVGLDMSGSTISLLVDGVSRATATDATITAAGHAGVRLGNSGDTAPESDTAGLQLDNFQVSPSPALRATDSKGTSTGDYFGGVLLGAADAINGDTDTAASFDGSNDYVSAPRTVGDDFSVETWFKSTQGIGTGTSWQQGAGLVDATAAGTVNDFGVSLRSDGRLIAGVGSVGTGNVSVLSSAGGYNDGTWHHVVFTRTKSTGAMALYVDGALVGSGTGGTESLTAATNFSFGRIATGTNYFAGALDEVAIYNTALSAATVAGHYSAGH